MSISSRKPPTKETREKLAAAYERAQGSLCFGAPWLEYSREELIGICHLFREQINSFWTVEMKARRREAEAIAEAEIAALEVKERE